MPALWGIDMAGVEPLSATAAYTEFLLATACTQDLGVTYAAMTPCMRLMRGSGFRWAVRTLGADLRLSGLGGDSTLVGTTAR